MGERLSIFRKEHGDPSSPPPELASELEMDAGKGVSADASEMIWTGGGKQFDLHAEFARWQRETALDEILLAIIDSNPQPNADSETDSRRRRLEQSKRQLLNRPAPEGQPPSREIELMREIARRYWIAYATNAEEPSLSSIAADVVLPNWKENGRTQEEVQGVTRSYINAFQKAKDRLLLETSAEGLPELRDNEAAVCRVIELLGELGIVKHPSP